jgi:hypothetical protein
MQSIINGITSITINDVGGVGFNAITGGLSFGVGAVTSIIISEALHSGEKIAKYFQVNNPQRFRATEGSLASRTIKALAFAIGIGVSLAFISQVSLVAIAAAKVLPLCYFTGLQCLMLAVLLRRKHPALSILPIMLFGGALLGAAPSPLYLLPYGICGALMGSFFVMPWAHFDIGIQSSKDSITDLLTLNNR